MGVHLLICTILVLFNISKLSPKWKATLVILIIFNFLTLAAYSRSGMLSYIIGIFCFLYFNKDETITLALKSLTKHIPLALLIIIPIYLTVQVQENFQGRAVGFGQLKENITSLAGTPEDATLEKNVLWRLLWWGNILDYSFSNKYILGATMRRDGSYKFAPDQRWGNFPAVSAAWIVSKESFFDPLISVMFPMIPTTIFSLEVVIRFSDFV